MTDDDSRDPFGSWEYEDELRLDIECLRDDVDRLLAPAREQIVRRPLVGLCVTALESEYAALRRRHWELITVRASSRRDSRNGVHYVVDDVPPRRRFTSPFSGDDIWSRSG